MAYKCLALLSAALLPFAFQGACGASPSAPPERPALQQSQPLQDKNFFLLSALEDEPGVRTLLAQDAVLEAIRQERDHALAQAQITCHGDFACVLKTALWTDEEVRTVSHELALAYAAKASPLHSVVEQKLRPSGAYASYAGHDDAALLAYAWEVCASGLNEIVTVYGLGQPGRYPLIDAATIDPHSSAFAQSGANLLPTAVEAKPFFFEPTLSLALNLLTLNHRDEAARFEPMEQGVNRPAIAALHGVLWQKYPYTTIVVPGSGGGTEADPLTEAGRRRVQLAAEAYHAGKAPLILVSGGYVHPSQTRFCEAEEMKKALMRDFHVPEAAILEDPHARHTTTNMRNAAREIVRYGIPLNKPALVVSDTAQIVYIAGDVFRDRCLREMGYVPYRLLDRVSETSVSFIPEPQSLEQDPIDPLDP